MLCPHMETKRARADEVRVWSETVPQVTPVSTNILAVAQFRENPHERQAKSYPSGGCLNSRRNSIRILIFEHSDRLIFEPLPAGGRAL